MSAPSQRSTVSFAVQGAKVGRDGTFDHTSYDWYKIPVPRIAAGPAQNQQTMPLELGGTITPRGAFKAGYFSGGEIDLIPRLENSIGWMLLAAMGSASSVTGVNADGVAASGVNTHIFAFDPSDQSSLPYCAIRRTIPAEEVANDLGESLFDMKINLLRFTVPNAGKIAMRMQMLGRDYSHENDFSDWAYANATFEDHTTTPEAGYGAFYINQEEWPIFGLTLDIGNGLTTPAMETVVGDPRPDDFICLTRAATLRLVLKWDDSELYQQVLNGSASGENWSWTPFEHLTSANGYALDGRFQAAELIGATNTPHEVRVRANRVLWSMAEPPELVAGGLVQVTFVGTIMQPDTGNYLEVVVMNAETGYVLP